MSDSRWDGFEDEVPKPDRMLHGTYDRLLAAFEKTGWKCAEVDLPVETDSLYAAIGRALARARKKNAEAFPKVRVLKGEGVVLLVRESEEAVACGVEDGTEVPGLRRAELTREVRSRRGRYEGLLSDFEASGLPSARVTLPVDRDALYGGIGRALRRARQENAEAFTGIRVVRTSDGVYLVRDE